jgi:hypothetical protein
MSALVTDDDLARARSDPGFRQQLMVNKLDLLLAALDSVRRANGSNPERARQLREGADLAVKLADRLQDARQSEEPPAGV